MNWIQIIGLIAALLLGVYNTLSEWERVKDAPPVAVESVYDVGEEPAAAVIPPVVPKVE